MTRAVIFDMDGLLIDSEPLWRKAEMAAFDRVGVSLTEADCRETMGYRLDEVVNLWYARRPWKGVSPKNVEADILERVCRLIREEGAPMPGVKHALELCRARDLKMAIASSSPMMLIEAVVEKLDLGGFLGVLHSAENETHGKPHPAVFLSTAETLGVPPEACTVLEDSIHGMVAALSAKMRAIVVPEPGMRQHPAFGAAHVVLDSLEDLEARHLG